MDNTKERVLHALMNDLGNIQGSVERLRSTLTTMMGGSATVSPAPSASTQSPFKAKDPKRVAAGKKAVKTRNKNKTNPAAKAKDPKWVAAGKKAARTRRKNADRIAKGLPVLAKAKDPKRVAAGLKAVATRRNRQK